MSKSDRLRELLNLLEATDGDTSGTSMRIPTRLRDAANIAVDLGLATSTTDITVQGLRDALETYAQRLVLDEHYRAHPDAKPTVEEIATSAARLDGNPVADRPDLISRAAQHLTSTRPGVTGDDVLLVAEGMLLTENQLAV